MVNYNFAYNEWKMEDAKRRADKAETVFVVFMALAIIGSVSALLICLIAAPRGATGWAIASLVVMVVLWLVTLVAYCRQRNLEEEHARFNGEQKDLYFVTLFADEDGNLPEVVTVNGEEVKASFARAMVHDDYPNGVHRYSVAGDYVILLGEGPAEIRAALLDAADKHSHDGVFRAVRGKKVIF